MTAVLTVQDVTALGPDGKGFRDLTFEVAGGEVIGLAELGTAELGPLLDVLAGLEGPVSGEITWNGISSRLREETRSSVKQYRLGRKLRLQVGFLSATASLIQNQGGAQPSQGWISEGYGLKKTAWHLVFIWQVSKEVQSFPFLIIPFENKNEVPGDFMKDEINKTDSRMIYNFILGKET